MYKDNASGGTMYLQFFPRAKTGTYEIPDTVTAIAPYVFQQSKITEIVIPDSVTSIGAGAFRNANKLEIVRFVFAGNTTGKVTIDKTAFTGCTAIQKFYLPAQADTVTVDMFRNMPALKEIWVEEGNTAYTSVDGMLCDAAVSGRTLLLSPKAKSGIVKIPTVIQKIAENAFANNEDILRLIVPNHVSTIGANAFSGCSGIVNVIFEGTRYTPLEIGQSAFEGLRNLRTVEFQPNASGNLDRGAVTIGAKAFANNAKLTTLTAGDGVNIAYVGEYAFANNARMGKLDISNAAAMVEIGSYAFSGNTALREIIIHASTTTIGSYAYQGCSYVTTVSFADGGQEVTFGSNVFENCERLATINIPANVTAFDGSAFTGCNGITTITVDPNNPYLTAEDGVLYDKAKTTMMYYPKARALDFTTLPDTLTTFGPAVFQDNQMITEVIIPKTVTSIGAYAFENCINLESITFENKDAAMEIGKYAFANCGKLTAITLPTKTTAIGDYTFSRTPIAAITIPETVTAIGVYAFEYTYITEVTIPAATTYVGSGAFANCNKLTSVTFAPGGEAPLTLGTDGVETSIFDGTSTVANAVELPARTQVIKPYAFHACQVHIAFAEGIQVTTIGDHAFEYAKILTGNVKLPKVVTLGRRAFYGTRIGSLELGNRLTDIAFQALANAGLTAVTFAEGNNNVKLNIDDMAFAYNSIVSIDLPVRTANIGSSEENFYTVFYGMGVTAIDSKDLEIKEEKTSYNLTSENVAYKGVKVGSSYGLWKSTLTAINIGSANQFYGSHDGVVYRKDSAGNMTVLLYCPRGKTGSYEVKLGTEQVVNRAFNATSLTELTFADYAPGHKNYGQAVLKIGSLVDKSYVPDYANDITIGNSSTLQAIRFPSTLCALGQYAVGYTKSLDTLTFKEDGASLSVGVYAITKVNEYNLAWSNGAYTYRNMSSSQYDTGRLVAVAEVKLPPISEMITLAHGASAHNFAYTNIKKFTLAEGTTLESIPRMSFCYTMIESMEIPASIKTVSHYAFSYNRALKEVSFEAGSQCVEIGSGVFQECVSLTAFVFPDQANTTLFGNEIFKGCTKLTTVTLGKSMNVLYTMSGTTPVFLFPSTVTSIIVPEDHPSLCDIDGVVFSKDKTTLVYYPKSKNLAHLTTNPELAAVWSSVKAIDHLAFYNCKGQITLPETLEYIGSQAFYGNTKLTSIHIPAKVKEIAVSAFQGCSAATKLTFAENSILDTIGAKAFYSCMKLTKVELPASLKNLGEQVFAVTQLSELVIPEGVTALPEKAFSALTSLEVVVLPSTLVDIGSFAFQNTAIKHIVIPASVRRIGQSVFKGCTRLESIIFEEDSELREVGREAFRNCSSLKEVVFPEGLTLIEGDIELSDSLTVGGGGGLIQIPGLGGGGFPGLGGGGGGLTITGHTFAGCTALHRVVLPKTLEYIPANMFDGCTALVTVEMPEATGRIGTSVFKNCKSLRSIEIAAETIGSRAFDQCTGLETVSISAKITKIGSYAFAGCSALRSVTIEDGCALTSLGDPEKNSGIFQGTTSLEYFDMPDSVTQIGRLLFENSGIKQVRLSENLDIIPQNAFLNCTNLTEIVLPVAVITVDDGAFMGCTGLTEVELSFVENLGINVFNGCTGLTKVILPDSLVQIKGNPFVGCVNLEQLVVNSTYFMQVDGVLYDAACYTLIYAPISTAGEIKMLDTVREIAPGAFAGTKITSVIISDYVEAIPADAFAGCTELTAVKISGNVKSIGDNAFAGCTKLAAIVIPKSVTSIGEEAFKGCAMLAAVEFEERNTEITIGENAFTGTLVKEEDLP